MGDGPTQTENTENIHPPGFEAAKRSQEVDTLLSKFFSDKTYSLAELSEDQQTTLPEGGADIYKFLKEARKNFSDHNLAMRNYGLVQAGLDASFESIHSPKALEIIQQFIIPPGIPSK